jgi:CRP-like cAMP-binding protein
MADFSNLLLSRLNADEMRRLRPHLEHVALNEGAVLAHPGEPVDYVYFIESGVVSIVSHLRDGSSIAVAAVGNEGVSGAFAILGTAVIPYELVVQISGTAFRIERAALRQQMMAGGQLLDLMFRYVQVLVGLLGQAAICNRYHSGRERLARWLLEAADRADRDNLPITHDFIAQMVGGARSLVSTALIELRERGALDYTRADVRLNREELRKHTCECYDAVKALFRVFEH